MSDRDLDTQSRYHGGNVEGARTPTQISRSLCTLISKTPELLHIADQFTQKQQTDEVVKIFVRKVPIHFLHVRHYYLAVDREEWKFETLCDLYEGRCVPQLVVFCNTREKPEWLTHALESPACPLNKGVSIEVAGMHADQSAQERAAVTQYFRHGGNIRFLIVATPLV
ncbi:Eukaryotic initiation factor 4A-III [Linnemannia gamsii]|uniref:Eukaryotic initiation factor 4A-III n=1 Tax=Linnemannia gamsii TaxID=64522 RepID=A0ABQ7K9P8_9FUNG|nr:Eukaryotic initiation factor 4A-III [Linnemannia gamsii]